MTVLLSYTNLIKHLKAPNTSHLIHLGWSLETTSYDRYHNRPTSRLNDSARSQEMDGMVYHTPVIGTPHLSQFCTLHVSWVRHELDECL
ncbi:hypothetical protein HanRHA438_Chr09g0397161 [Helianthus annuus]|nr:hypothetical protein HanRHA438_Chr09g0397161 [Helianthus annuus]